MKLLLKCALVSVPIWGLSICLCLGKMHYSNEDFAYTFWNKIFTETKQDKDYKYIVIGDSSCNSAYMPEVISDSMVNLSIGGSSTVEGYYVLKDYLNNNALPTDVFLSYHDSHFKYTEAYWDKIVPAHRFSLLDNLEIINNARILEDDTGLFYADFGSYADAVACQIYFPSKYITALLNSTEEDRYTTNLAAFEKVQLHKGRYTTIGNAQFVTTQYRPYTEFPVKPLYDYYFKKTVELCVENNIAVHIIKPPMPDNSQMTEEYINQVNEYYNYYVQNYPNVTFNWDEEQRMYTANDFADEIHLNNDGALRFSTYVKEEFADIFADETKYTSSQMLGIDDSIAMENVPEDLFYFMGDRNYTILVYDQSGYINKFEEEYAEPNGFTISQMDDNELNNHDNNIYYCKGNNVELENYEISDDEERIVITVDGKETSWVFNDEASISMLIIDNVNDEVVAIKNLQYTEGYGFSRYLL